jgi:glycine/D-amino acid oxidase-like deaminating enzyme
VVTRAKDLRTGHAVWETRPTARLPQRALDRDLKTDVLIVGAGITGAMVADALTADGFKTSIVDKRGPARGSTTASTALVLYEIDTPLIKLTRKIGRDNAVRAWRRSRLAVDAIAARLAELGVRDVELRNSLYLAGDLLDADGLRREYHARIAAGLASRFLDRKELRDRFDIARSAALLSYGDLLIDPRITTLALLKAAVACGASIHSPVEIVHVQATPSGVTAVADNGRIIRCRHLVLATGYELPKRVPRRGHRIVSTWAIATRPQPRRLWPERCMIWEASEPYLYLRTTPDGRIICGGGDEDFSDEAARDALLGRKTRTLRRKLGRLIRGADTRADFAWTGSFGTTTTGLPKIGAIPGMPNCWAALGYGGNGTTYARIAADVIRGALAGRPDTDAKLYDF